MRANGAYGDALMIMDIPVNIIMSLVFVALGVVYLFFSRLKMKNLPYQVDLVNVTS
jgi:phosphatidylglycerol:prolipoprotein diacylglycerol transferase